MVTVIIPTTGRPTLLQIALQSVANQTAVAKISRVYVSENAGDRKSELVCQKFPQLPITYFYQDPPTGPLEHGQFLMKNCLEGEFTCILHDDDGWLPHHLEDGLAAMEADPDAAVYGANLLLYQDDVALPHLNCSLMAWVAASYPLSEPLWRISHTNVVIGSIPNFIVHYSSMIARTEAFRKSAYVYELGNPYDNDRMLLFALTRCGPLLFNPTVSVAVRCHAGQETSRFAQEERNRRMCETTQWMVESSRKPWSVIASALAQRLAACPNEEVKADLLRDATLREWCWPELARHLDRTADASFFQMYDRALEIFSGARPQKDR